MKGWSPGLPPPPLLCPVLPAPAYPGPTRGRLPGGSSANASSSAPFGAPLAYASPPPPARRRQPQPQFVLAAPERPSRGRSRSCGGSASASASVLALPATPPQSSAAATLSGTASDLPARFSVLWRSYQDRLGDTNPEQLKSQRDLLLRALLKAEREYKQKFRDWRAIETELKGFRRRSASPLPAGHRRRISLAPPAAVTREPTPDGGRRAQSLQPSPSFARLNSIALEPADDTDLRAWSLQPGRSALLEPAPAADVHANGQQMRPKCPPSHAASPRAAAPRALPEAPAAAERTRSGRAGPQTPKISEDLGARSPTGLDGADAAAGGMADICMRQRLACSRLPAAPLYDKRASSLRLPSSLPAAPDPKQEAFLDGVLANVAALEGQLPKLSQMGEPAKEAFLDGVLANVAALEGQLLKLSQRSEYHAQLA